MSTRPAQLVHEECERTIVDLSVDTTTIFIGSCLLFGIYVNTVLSAQACPIEDNTTAIITLVASLAAGSNLIFPGVPFETDMIVDPDNSATGNITVLWRRVNPG